MGNKIDLSSLWRKEDWIAVWIGFIILSLASLGIFWWLPKINSWNISPIETISMFDIPSFIALYMLLIIFTYIGIIADRRWNVKIYIKGFTVLYIISILSFVVSKQSLISNYGLEYVLWALVFGLIVSNIFGVPQWLRSAINTELYIKIGLVLLGAEILFQNIIKAGFKGILQALAVVFVIWYTAYYIARKLKLDKEFSAVLATGVSICGVSAAIAAAGAIRADPKKVGHVIGLVLLTSIILLLVMPPLAKFIGLSTVVAGAWIGGTIDTTPAVVAAGAFYGNEALTIAAITKMAQNVLIGIVAFLLAVFWTFKVEKNYDEKPSLFEVWYRFPKFIVGFILASLTFSILLIPYIGYENVKLILINTKGFRNLFFSLAFISIGLESKFKDLINVGRGRPAVAYVIAQTINIIWTFIVASIIWIML